MRTDGKVVTWGSNDWGALGLEPGVAPDVTCPDGGAGHCTTAPSVGAGLP